MNDGRRNATWILATLLLVLSLLLAAKHRTDIAGFLRAPAPATLATAAAAPASAANQAQPAAPGALRVLFIGNSLTAANDIPAMVARLATAAHQPRAFEYRVDAPGGFGLSEHAVSGRLQAHLEGARWDSVVLQDQGQRPGWWREAREKHLNVPARVLDRAIRAAGSRPVFYSTFARREGDFSNYPGDTYDAMQARLIDGYAQIARELNAAVVPIGAIWQRVHHEHPSLRLWVQDGSHPSVAGAYLAACAFYAHFYRDSPLGNAYVAGLDPVAARAIQEGVAERMLGWRQAGEAMQSDVSARPVERNLPVQASDEVARAQASAAAVGAQAETAQDRTRHAQIEADRRERALRTARERVPIKLYSTTWCGYCQRASAYMREAGIAFEEHDIDQDAAAKAAAHRINPRGSVPTIDLDGEVLIGWNPKEFESTLDRAARTRARL